MSDFLVFVGVVGGIAMLLGKSAGDISGKAVLGVCVAYALVVICAVPPWVSQPEFVGAAGLAPAHIRPAASLGHRSLFDPPPGARIDWSIIGLELLALSPFAACFGVAAYGGYARAGAKEERKAGDESPPS